MSDRAAEILTELMSAARAVMPLVAEHGSAAQYDRLLAAIRDATGELVISLDDPRRLITPGKPHDLSRWVL